MTETATATPTPDALASVLADAPFVRLVATDDGDAVAAAGLLAGALRQRAVPFQARVSRDPLPETGADEVAVTVGTDSGPHSIPGTGRPASTTAFAVARELGADPDPVVTLAGGVAAGSIPGTDGTGDALGAAERAGSVTRRPGVAIPCADLADGISASTLLRTPYSGDPEATRATLATLDLPATLDDDAHRRLASLVAVDVAAAEGASDRAPSAVERALRPYAIGESAPAAPFRTVGGYADVLDVLAREEPGTGVALALATDPGDGLVSAARDAWRDHGLATHRALDAATTGRYDGCFVARVDAPASTLPTIARIVREFRSPEPVVAVLDESSGRIAAAATEPTGLGDVCRSVAAALRGGGGGGGARGGGGAGGGPPPPRRPRLGDGRTRRDRDGGGPDGRPRGAPGGAMTDERGGPEPDRATTERSEPTERSKPTRTATVRTTHADAGVVAAALAPDDTDSMSVAVDGDTIEARIERPTTGGLRSTVDDYVVNLRVADRVIESTERIGKTNAKTTNAKTTNTNADDTTNTNT